MNKNPSELEGTLSMLHDGKIIFYEYENNILRLEIDSPKVEAWNPDFDYFNLIIKGCRNIKYVSYLVKGAQREFYDPEKIFSKRLEIKSVERKGKNYFIIFCTSFHNQIEGGEIHFTAEEFGLFDQEFEAISFEALKNISLEWWKQHEEL